MRLQKSISLLRLLTSAALLYLLPVAYSSATPVTYLVNVDTSSLQGASGFLDFDLAPGNDSQSASAIIGDFASSGTLTGAPQISGNVSGSLPGSVILNNSTQFNDYFQGFNYGQSIAFLLMFDGPALTSPDGHSTSGSTFVFGLFDQTGTNPLLTTDPNGNVFTVNLNLDGTATPTVFSSSPGGSSAASLTPIPEPSFALLLFCLASAAAVFGRKRMSPR